jgi:hypothetical protein
LAEEDIKRLTKKDIEKLKQMKVASDFNMKVITNQASLGQRHSPLNMSLQLPSISKTNDLLQEIDDEIEKSKEQRGGGKFYRRELKKLQRYL